MNHSRTRKSYNKEYKEKLVKRMLPPEEISANQLSKETGVAKSTLRIWLLEKEDNQKNNKDDIKWVSVNLDKEKIEEKRNSQININIDGVVIEINKGFDSHLLLEVM
jgi:transposase-like protein